MIDRGSDGRKLVHKIMKAPNMVLILSNQKKYICLEYAKISRCIITRFLLYYVIRISKKVEKRRCDET